LFDTANGDYDCSCRPEDFFRFDPRDLRPFDHRGDPRTEKAAQHIYRF